MIRLTRSQRSPAPPSHLQVLSSNLTGFKNGQIGDRPWSSPVSRRLASESSNRCSGSRGVRSITGSSSPVRNAPNSCSNSIAEAIAASQRRRLVACRTANTMWPSLIGASTRSMRSRRRWIGSFISWRHPVCWSPGSMPRSARATENFAPCWKSTALWSKPAPSATKEPPLRHGDETRAHSPKPREAQPCPRPDVTFCGSPAMRLHCRRHSTMQANSICLRLNVSVIVRLRAGQPRWWCVERRVKLPP